MYLSAKLQSHILHKTTIHDAMQYTMYQQQQQQ